MAVLKKATPIKKAAAKSAAKPAAKAPVAKTVAKIHPMKQRAIDTISNECMANFKVLLSNLKKLAKKSPEVTNELKAKFTAQIK